MRPDATIYQNYASFFKNAFAYYFYKTVTVAWCSEEQNVPTF